MTRVDGERTDSSVKLKSEVADASPTFLTADRVSCIFVCLFAEPLTSAILRGETRVLTHSAAQHNTADVFILCTHVALWTRPVTQRKVDLESHEAHQAEGEILSENVSDAKGMSGKLSVKVHRSLQVLLLHYFIKSEHFIGKNTN